MHIRTYIGLAIVPLFFAFCPSLLAVGYAWDFTGGTTTTTCTVKNRVNSCANPGNSMSFQAKASGGVPVTVTITAWYVNGNNTLQSATLGDYAKGLGDCSQNCSNSSNEAFDNNNGDGDEYLLVQFSAPVDPNSIKITMASPTSSKTEMDVSYWLGSTSSQPINLTNMDMTTSLSTLGFGSQKASGASSQSTARTVNFSGAPSAPVNAVLFGTMYGYSGDTFDISGISASTFAASVPEPASIFLLFTVIVAGLRVTRGGRALRSRGQADPTALT